MSGAADGRAIRPNGRPGFGVANARLGGDGLAYAARLIARALESMQADCPLVDLGARDARPVSAWRRARFVTRLVFEQARHGTDWWVFNHVGIARAQSWLPTALRRPYAVFVNGIEAWDPALDPQRQSVLRHAAARIAISHHTAARVREVHPGIGSVIACPLALLPDEGDASAQPDESLLARIPPQSVVIVGRMSRSERYKGHDQLLECWPAVLASCPDAHLVIVGKGDDADRLSDKARSLGIAGRVQFTGFVPDGTLPELYRRAGVFAMPSRGEGFGLVYLEAMRAGTPCIGSNADAASDIIQDARTGFLVDPDDRAALASRVTRLLQDRALRDAFGEAGRRRYEAEYTFEAFRARLFAILADTFGGAVSGAA